MESKFSNQFTDIIKNMGKSITDNMDKDIIVKIISDTVKEFSDANLVK